MQIFGKNGALCAGSKLTFGDFGRQSFNSWNAFIGEYGTDDTDQLWLHRKMGIYMTYSNGTVVAFYEVNQGNAFKFNCDLYSNGIKLTSDERLKENIQPLKSSLSSLKKLNGVSYNLKKPKMTAPGQEKKLNNGEMPSDKEQKAMAFFEQWDNDLNNSKDLRDGFLAQDLQGKQLMQVPITQRGESSHLISGHHFSAGMYLYALIVDGAVIDTKRMILTK